MNTKPIPVKTDKVPLLETRNLKKYFKTPKGMLHALDDVSLRIERGQTLGVVGESGCGKTTLGRTVLRLIDATAGEVLYDGENILKYDQAKMGALHRQMQLIFQDPYSSLNPRMSVSELIAEPIKVQKTCSSNKEMHKKVVELMETVGLSNRFINTYPHELDGGRRQRIGVARALALEPRFIVCDEPVSALDVSIQAQILNLMMDLQEERGLTYMFITHNLSVVKHISNVIAVMYLGQCVELSSTDELFENPLHPYTRALLRAIPVPSLHSAEIEDVIEGEVTSPIEPKPGCRFFSRCPQATPKCTEEGLKLKEIVPGHSVACTLYGF